MKKNGFDYKNLLELKKMSIQEIENCVVMKMI